MAKNCIGKFKTCFNPSDKDWECCFLYDIYEVNEEKYIRVIYESGRADRGKKYLSWIALDLRFVDVSMKLSDFLKWDPYYQEAKLLEPYENEWEDMEDPEWAFNVIDTVIRGGEEKGSRHLLISDLTLDTPNGRYYY